MTYFGFLLIFLIIPIAVFAIINILDIRSGKVLPQSLRGANPWIALAILVVLAVVYTTPWDNYLVATQVWWYSPSLVTGVLLGWVPIEEYAFFVLQTILTGLWTIVLARRFQFRQPEPEKKIYSLIVIACLVIIWGICGLLLWQGTRLFSYFSLLFFWAIPPVVIQLVFGADILWKHRFLVLIGIVIPTIYLSVTDNLAISSGTWIISPEKSTGIFINRLPIEEIFFFLTTNTLIVMGLILAIASDSQVRLIKIRQTIQRIFN
jgi:lycopene beta-cyclase